MVSHSDSVKYCCFFPLIYYRGIGTIDIALSDIDVNECDEDPEETVTSANQQTRNIFRGTHYCQPSTKASVPIDSEMGASISVYLRSHF